MASWQHKSADISRYMEQRSLAGTETAACSRCYDVERHNTHTLRIHANETYAHHQLTVDSTQLNGTVDKVNLVYLDVRFSNICNLKCRTCGPQLSSGWYDDALMMDAHYKLKDVIITKHRHKADLNNAV